MKRAIFIAREIFYILVFQKEVPGIDGMDKVSCVNKQCFLHNPTEVTC